MFHKINIFLVDGSRILHNKNNVNEGDCLSLYRCRCCEVFRVCVALEDLCNYLWYFWIWDSWEMFCFFPPFLLKWKCINHIAAPIWNPLLVLFTMIPVSTTRKVLLSSIKGSGEYYCNSNEDLLHLHRYFELLWLIRSLLRVKLKMLELHNSQRKASQSL